MNYSWFHDCEYCFCLGTELTIVYKVYEGESSPHNILFFHVCNSCVKKLDKTYKIISEEDYKKMRLIL